MRYNSPRFALPAPDCGNPRRSASPSAMASANYNDANNARSGSDDYRRQFMPPERRSRAGRPDAPRLEIMQMPDVTANRRPGRSRFPIRSTALKVVGVGR